MQLACFAELLSILNQNLTPQAPDGLKNLSFSIIWAAFHLHPYYTPLLRFCLDKQKWMQSQQVGNSSSESLNEAPNLEMELAGGAQSLMDSGLSTACNLFDSKRPLGAVNQPQELHSSDGQSQGII